MRGTGGRLEELAAESVVLCSVVRGSLRAVVTCGFSSKVEGVGRQGGCAGLVDGIYLGVVRLARYWETLVSCKAVQAASLQT